MRELTGSSKNGSLDGMTFFRSCEHSLNPLSSSDEGSRKIDVTTGNEREGRMSACGLTPIRGWKSWVTRGIGTRWDHHLEGEAKERELNLPSFVRHLFSLRESPDLLLWNILKLHSRSVYPAPLRVTQAPVAGEPVLSSSAPPFDSSLFPMRETCLVVFVAPSPASFCWYRRIALSTGSSEGPF